jgi:uncharacterized protein
MGLLIIAIVICFVAGIFSGLLGIGGGLVMVPLFHYVLKMNLHQAVGTSLAIIVPTALVGAIRHAQGNYINWNVFLFATLFAVVGGFIGAGISMNIDVGMIRKIFALFMILAAIKMFFQ